MRQLHYRCSGSLPWLLFVLHRRDYSSRGTLAWAGRAHCNGFKFRTLAAAAAAAAWCGISAWELSSSGLWGGAGVCYHQIGVLTFWLQVFG